LLYSVVVLLLLGTFKAHFYLTAVACRLFYR